MFDRRAMSMYLSATLLLQLSSAFYLMEDRYKKMVHEYEEVETITDPVKVKLLMSQPAKEEVKFTPVLIPEKFSRYDNIDHNGHISLKELIRTTGAERNAKNAFQAADKDADGEISQEEFKMAPWAMRPPSEDRKDDEDYPYEAKFENVRVEEEEEVKAENKVETDGGEGREDIEEEKEQEEEEEKDEERDTEKGGEGESLVGNGEKEGEELVRGEEKENDTRVIIEKVEAEEVSLEEGEGGVEAEGEGGVEAEGEGKEEKEDEKATEKKLVGTVDRKVEVGEEDSKVEGGKEEATEKKIVGGVKTAGEDSKVGGEGEGEEVPDKKIVGGVDGKVVGGEGVKGEIENTERLRNESASVGEGKEKIEKSKEADNTSKSKDEDEEYIEIEDLDTQIQHPELEILDPHEIGGFLDTIDDKLNELDHIILDDLENHELIDEEESSGELIDNDNEESHSDKERNTNGESYVSFTD